MPKNCFEQIFKEHCMDKNSFPLVTILVKCFEKIHHHCSIADIRWGRQNVRYGVWTRDQKSVVRY